MCAGVGWRAGSIFSWSKQRLLIIMLETETKKQIHSWFVALVPPLAPLKTNPSIKHSRWTALKRETAGYVLENSLWAAPLCLSAREEPKSTRQRPTKNTRWMSAGVSEVPRGF